jgi:membrane protein implicated in regulation of membrane protease activity
VFYMLGILKLGGRLGAVFALILVIIALIKQLITLVGFLLVVVKIAIVVIFVAILVLIVLAIFRDRSRKRHDIDEI